MSSSFNASSFPSFPEWCCSSKGMEDLVLVAVSSTYAAAGVVEVFVLSGILVWMFNSRIRAMLDVISSRFQDQYSGTWENESVKQSSASLHHQLSQYQLKKREQVIRAKTASQAAFDHALFHIKEAEWNQLTESEKRPFVGLSCQDCTPSSRNAAIQDDNLPVMNILQVDSLDERPKGLLGKIFPIFTHCISNKKFDYPYIYQTVLKDEVLENTIKESSSDIANEIGEADEKTLSQILSRQKKRAMSILTAMRSTLSDVILKIAAWVFYKTLPILFNSMSIPQSQITMLKKASMSGLPLIFLPLHRSHVDYIAVTFTLTNNNIRSPLVAAGENLRIPVFGWILRGLGAFFIKRRMDPVSGKKDKLYRAILQTYMTQCIEAGHNFEMFIEGGRTRTGKPCMPKGGLLSVFVDAYLSGVLQDALLVPVSINYERLVEGNFVREQTGEPKKPETFMSALSGIWSALTRHYGNVRVDFNQPFSLNELVRSFQTKVKINSSNLHVSPSTSSLYGTDIMVEEQKQLVDSIARHIIYDCSKSTAVMSTNALAFLLLNVYREGVKLIELVEALDKLRTELRNGGKDVGFTGESIDVIDHAVEMLGNGLVKKEKRPDGIFIKPVTMLPNVIELAYYSNTLLPHFVLEGIVGATLASLSREDKEAKVSYDKIIDTCTSLCEILQFEFLFTKPCQNLNDALFEVIDNINLLEIIKQVQLQNAPGKSSLGCPSTMDIIDDEEEEEYFKIVCPVYRINSSHPKLALYSTILMPIIDTYAVTIQALFTLVKRELPESFFVNYVLSQIRSLLEKGVIKFGESLSTDSVKNCIKMLEKMSILDCNTQSGVKLCYLTSKYDNELEIEALVERIQRFQIGPKPDC